MEIEIFYIFADIRETLKVLEIYVNFLPIFISRTSQELFSASGAKYTLQRPFCVQKVWTYKWTDIVNYLVVSLRKECFQIFKIEKKFLRG